MEEKNEKSIVPINSTNLVRFGNFIAITKKILNERVFENFKGELIQSIFINKNHYYSTLLIDNDILYLMAYDTGHIVEVNLKNHSVSENNTLFNFLNNEIKKTRPYTPRVKSFCTDSNTIYILSDYDKLLTYDLNNNSIKKIELDIDLKLENDKLYNYYSILIYNDKLLLNGNVIKIDGNKITACNDSNFSIVMDKCNFHIFDYYKMDDDYSFDDIFYNSGMLYKTCNEMGYEYEGKIRIQKVGDYNYYFLNVFESCGISELIFYNDNTMICYSNFTYEKEGSLLRIIDIRNNQVLNKIKLKGKICNWCLLRQENILMLIFEDGEVGIYTLINFKLKKIKRFFCENLVETDEIKRKLDQYRPFIFEVVNNQIIIGNRKQINIYK